MATVVLHDHMALKDLMIQLREGVDEVDLYTYMIGVNAPLGTFYSSLETIPHRIFVGWARDQRAEAHSACTSLLLSYPKLNLYLLANSHVKHWAVRRKKSWFYYTGSYNLHPTNSAQLMIRTSGTPIIARSAGAEKVTFNGKNIFAGVPFTSRTSPHD